MKDKEMLADLLASEKKLSSNYESFASECVDVALRDEFLHSLVKVHDHQSTLWSEANARGWYTVEQADQQKISQAYCKLSAGN